MAPTWGNTPQDPRLRRPGALESWRPTVEPLLSDASAQSACAATAVCVKAGARRDGGGEEGGDGGGRGGGGHEAGSLLAEETCVAASRSLRNIVGVSRPDRSWEVGPGRTCCAGPGRGDALPLPAGPARAAPRPSAAGSGGGDGG